MERYLIWINELEINGVNFLEYMYPEIKENYDFINDMYIKRPLDLEQREIVKFTKEEIAEQLFNNNIPEYLLLEKREGKIIEVISGEELNISSNTLNLRRMENEEIIDNYINSLTTGIIDMLNEQIPFFNKKVKNKEKIK